MITKNFKSAIFPITDNLVDKNVIQDKVDAWINELKGKKCVGIEVSLREFVYIEDNSNFLITENFENKKNKSIDDMITFSAGCIDGIEVILNVFSPWQTKCCVVYYE